jgi:hypothetical protein
MVTEIQAIGVIICSIVCVDLMIWFFLHTFGLRTLLEFFINENWAPSVHMAILAIALAIGIIIIIY